MEIVLSRGTVIINDGSVCFNHTLEHKNCPCCEAEDCYTCDEDFDRLEYNVTLDTITSLVTSIFMRSNGLDLDVLKDVLNFAIEEVLHQLKIKMEVAQMNIISPVEIGRNYPLKGN